VPHGGGIIETHALRFQLRCTSSGYSDGGAQKTRRRPVRTQQDCQACVAVVHLPVAFCLACSACAGSLVTATRPARAVRCPTAVFSSCALPPGEAIPGRLLRLHS